MAGHAVDTVNYQMVGVQGGRVTVTLPKPAMTPAEAVLHAAWLVALAEALDPDVDFAAVLAAVRST
jgi:hypothetical protein